ncbi:dnaJ protein ERDJ3B-like [Helianthus annuus]|uniref:dnaJ protein ERDJ3B-like n=1 Tax=Helianthus annuus TaxID=4232 RepID=UPI001652BC6B|nr:dnaJ protein ERDJ3B-like [Helianthus annuus]
MRFRVHTNATDFYSEKRSIYDRYGEEGLKQHAAGGGGGGGGMNIQDVFKSCLGLADRSFFFSAVEAQINSLGTLFIGLTLVIRLWG